MKQILILGNATVLTLGPPGYGVEIVGGTVSESYLDLDEPN